MAGGASNTEYQWRLPAEMLHRDHWHQPHFERLTHFGMWCRQDEGAVFSANRGPVLQLGGNLLVLGSTTAQVGLVKELTAAVSTDGFLSGVFESVKDSIDNLFRNFSSTRLGCCAISGMKMSVRGCVCLAHIWKLSCARRTVTACWQVIRVLIARTQRFHMHIIGQVLRMTLLTFSGHAQFVQQLRAPTSFT